MYPITITLHVGKLTFSLKIAKRENRHPGR